ncbi:MAG: hypothetical protein JWN74_273 [Acidobacteriaceae bacterium]|nr:hypothetical protein [Acidobacteriaceae bacterium]
MKLSVLLFALTCLLIVNGQEKGSKTKPHQNNSQLDKTSVTPTIGVNAVDQKAPARQEKPAAEHPNGYLSRLLSPENLPNVGLFVIGVIGILVAISTLKDVQKQTRNTQIAAEAAYLNSKAVIKSERPWVTGGEGRDSFRLFGNPALVPRFWLALKNSGRTPGKLVRVLMKFEKRSSIDDLRGIEHDLNFSDICPIPYVLIIPGDNPFQISCTIAGDQPLSPEEINEIRDGDKFLVVYGVIEYEDVFETPETEHKSGFFFYYAYGSPTSHGFQTYYSAHPDYLQVT